MLNYFSIISTPTKGQRATKRNEPLRFCPFRIMRITRVLAAYILQNITYVQCSMHIVHYTVQGTQIVQEYLILVLKMMGSKNACTLEFACILGRNIKCSVIIIIKTRVRFYPGVFVDCILEWPN